MVCGPPENSLELTELSINKVSRYAVLCGLVSSWTSREKGLRSVSTQENEHRIGSDWTLFHLELSTPPDQKS